MLAHSTCAAQGITEELGDRAGKADLRLASSEAGHQRAAKRLQADVEVLRGNIQGLQVVVTGGAHYPTSLLGRIWLQQQALHMCCYSSLALLERKGCRCD